MSTGPRRLGKYELHERLGRGGMAEVWKALDTQLERYVAIKLLHADLQNDPDFMKRFIREAQVVASLHHPNIVQVHDFQTSPSDSGNTIVYMVMDYVQGQTLTEYIRGTSGVGNFPPASEIVHLFACISSAIDYAHQRGMIHRDIKPANILLDQRNPLRYQMGMPILTDFGIVKLLGVSTNTLTGWWLGTPLYISPEQAQGHPGNERSDIYSLGVILYEICTGLRPFQGDSPVAIIMQHISTMPTPPDLINPKITPALANVITRGLAKDPAARFPSASSMAAALADAFNMSTPANLHPSAPTARAISGPNHWNSAQVDLPLSITLSSPASTSPTIGSSSAPPPIAPTPGFGQGEVGLHIISSSESTPTTPVRDLSASSPIANLGQSLPGTVPSQLPPELSPPPPSTPRRWKGRFVASIALLILILMGSIVGAFYLLPHKGPITTSTTNQIVGHATFFDSGQLNDNNSQGINDELQINLQSIPDFAPGNSYYGWLLSDNNQHPMTSIFLGKLSVNQGDVHFLYTGNTQHTNLIATTSRFLITEENTNSTPKQPSLDRHTWRYYAELPQKLSTTNPTDNFSMLNQLRYLLSGNSISTVSTTSGGLAIWLLRNTQRVLEQAGNAREAWNSKEPDSIHSYIIRALDYLDGTVLIQKDVPTSTPLLIDQNLFQTPLFDIVPDPSPSSYLSQIDRNLQHLIEAPGISPDKIKLANQTDLVLINTLDWLKRVHNDAKQLFSMTATQLLSQEALSTLNDMVSQANYAYDGQIDPSTGKVQQEGVRQIYADIQRLATFDVRAYTPQ